MFSNHERKLCSFFLKKALSLLYYEESRAVPQAEVRTKNKASV
jgi:hypothetical protein